uniref:Uncharacterized protein n=1 Tax=Anguilla anguilla TaxID=7936 RepID=A0A0E9RHN0_ANGAN
MQSVCLWFYLECSTCINGLQDSLRYVFLFNGGASGAMV